MVRKLLNELLPTRIICRVDPVGAEDGGVEGHAVVGSGLGEGDVVHAGADREVVECVVAHIGQLEVDTPCIHSFSGC
jgi:hypothetical protein